MDRMQKNVLNVLVITVCVLGLSGCGRMVDWGKRTFYQGENQETNLSTIQNHIRSITAYDQFDTVAQFDALWLSSQVRELYAYFYTRLIGKGDEYKHMIERRQLEENNHFVMFYVLSPYKDILGKPESMWHLFLEIDGVRYSPIEIKEVDLAPLYKEFFGKRLSVFKKAYQVKFDAQDVDNIPIIRDETTCLVLYFRSLRKEVSLSWTLPVNACTKEAACAPKQHGAPEKPESDKCCEAEA